MSIQLFRGGEKGAVAHSEPKGEVGFLGNCAGKLIRHLLLSRVVSAVGGGLCLKETQAKKTLLGDVGDDPQGGRTWAERAYFFLEGRGRRLLH